MRNFDRCAKSGTALAVVLSIAGSANATPIVLPPPPLPVPQSLGTGVSSRWVNGIAPADELDTALSFLTPTSFALEGVGPVSFSNNLAPIGDFATHTPMPYSTEGIPEDTGWYLASRMTGGWVARQTGTYTFAVGADDGFRITLAGIVLLVHAPAEPFRREAASFVVSEAGLYPIVVEYFNGVEEGAVELSFAPGEVALESATTALPSTFQLVPLHDLYPPDALDSVDDGGAAAPAANASAPSTSPGFASTSVDPGDASPGEAASAGLGDVPAGGGNVPPDAHWHGGGCALGAADRAPPVWLASMLAILLAVFARWRTR